MRLIGYLIITISLCLGATMAATSYVIPLSLPDDRLIGLTLNAPAGQTDDGAPLITQTTPEGEPRTLDAETPLTLRDAGVERIRVKEFAFNRWSGRWLFILAVFGLAVGASLVRADLKQRTEAAAGASPEAAGTPPSTLAEIRRAIDDLLARLPALESDDARMQAIIEEIGELQQTHIARFADSRTQLVGRYGLAGFAAVMDSFASAERQVNRAWSAAADDLPEEAIECLQLAAQRLADTAERMKA